MSDTPSCGITIERHSDDSNCVIYDRKYVHSTSHWCCQNSGISNSLKGFIEEATVEIHSSSVPSFLAGCDDDCPTSLGLQKMLSFVTTLSAISVFKRKITLPVMGHSAE
jgi:hypothetical protein